MFVCASFSLSAFYDCELKKTHGLQKAALRDDGTIKGFSGQYSGSQADHLHRAGVTGTDLNQYVRT